MRMNVKIDGNLHQALRIEAFNKRQSLQDLIDSVLKRHIAGGDR